VVADPCLQGSFDLEVQVVENATISQSCKSEFFSAITAKMTAEGCDTSRGNAAKKELEELIDLGNETLARYVASVCNHARTRQEMAETFESIAARASRQFDFQEFFDGGTYLNEEIGSLDVDGQFIDDVFNDIAQNNLIEFPSDAYNCRSNAAICCW